MATSANSRLVARLPRTAFRPGVSGNPRGKLPGTKNRATVEAREFANRLIDDNEYRDARRRRMIAGTADAMEPGSTFWYNERWYEFAEPKDS